MSQHHAIYCTSVNLVQVLATYMYIHSISLQPHGYMYVHCTSVQQIFSASHYE